MCLTRCETRGAAVSEELAAHLTPAQHDHINFYGTYSFDVDSECAATAAALCVSRPNAQDHENTQIRAIAKRTPAPALAVGPG